MLRNTSSVVGSAQCKSSNTSTKGCALAPAMTQLVSAASCRRRNSSGANLDTRSLGSGISSSGASKGAFSAASSLTCASEFSRSASRRSAGVSAPPKRCRKLTKFQEDEIYRRVLEGETRSALADELTATSPSSSRRMPADNVS